MGHCRSAIRPPFAGGLEAITWHLATRLADRGHQVTVFAADGSDCGPQVQVLTPATLGTVVHSGQPWLETRQDVNRAYAALVGRARELDIDVVHNHSLNPTLLRLRSTLQAPVLTTLHTPPLRPMRRAFRAVPAGPHEVAAVSHFTAASWRPEVEAQCVYNGIDTATWRLGPGGEGLSWFGRLVPEKGADVAIQWARRLGMPLQLAGPVSDPAWFDARLRPLLGGEITYQGHLSGHGLAEMVGASAATLVTPAWDEPFGMVAAEAAATGTPVLALRRGGLPEVVQPTMGQLLGPDPSTGELTQAMDRCLRLDRAGVRAASVATFDLEAMVTTYEHTYDRLLGQAGQQARQRLTLRSAR